MDGPLCPLGPPSLVADGELFSTGLLSIGDGFVVSMMGLRPYPQNHLGMMLARLDARGRVDVPVDFVVEHRFSNGWSGGAVWTGAEILVTRGDLLGAPSGYWQAARVSDQLETRWVEQGLRGEPCSSPSLVQADASTVQLLCVEGALSAFVFGVDGESFSDRGSFPIADRGVDDAVAAWDGGGLGVVWQGDALRFGRFTLDGAPLSPILELASGDAVFPSIAWNGSSFGIAYALRDDPAEVSGSVRYAHVSSEGEHLGEAELARGDHVAWFPLAIDAVGDGFVVGWTDGLQDHYGPARLQVLPIDASGRAAGPPVVLADVADDPIATSLGSLAFARSPYGLGVVHSDTTIGGEHDGRSRVWFSLLGPTEACP